MKTTTILFPLLVAGCYSAGQKRIADDSVIQKIQPGKTTKAEVLQLLGRPVSMIMMPDGSEQWLYQYIGSTVRAASFIPVVGLFAGGADTEVHNLQLFIRQDGVVEKLGQGVMVGGGGGLQDTGNPQPVESQEPKTEAPPPSPASPSSPM